MQYRFTPLFFTSLLLLLFSGQAKSAESVMPDNDDLCNATAINVGDTCGEVFNIDTDMATAQLNEPDIDCGNSSNSSTVFNSVWFSFVAPESIVRIQAIPEEVGRNFQLYQLQLFTLNGDCDNLVNLTPVDCNVPSSNLTNSPSIITTLEEGVTYYAQVSGTTDTILMESFNSTGCFSVTEVVTPDNDNVCDAINLTVNAEPQLFNNVGATAEAGEFEINPPADGFLATGDGGWASFANLLDNSVWFTFTTPDEVGKITVDLQGSINIGGNFNAQVAVYSATDCGDFTTYEFVGGNDNSSFDIGNGFSFLNAQPILELFCLPPNTTYYVVVDGAPNFLFTNPTANQGDFLIQVTEEELAPLSLRSLVEGPGCTGEQSGTILVAGQGGAGEFTYLWDDGRTDPDIIKDIVAGEYTVTITDQCGNTTSGSVTVPESLFPAPVVDAGEDLSICVGEEITLNGQASEGLLFDDNRLYTIAFSGLFTRNNIYLPELQDTLRQDLSANLVNLEFVENTLYGVSNENRFYSINTSNGDTTVVADSLEIPLLRSLSYAPTADLLYGIDGNASVYTIDPGSGTTTLLSDHPVEGFINGATIDDQGKLFVTTEASKLLTFNLGETQADTIGDFFSNFASFAGLEIDPNTDKLYYAGTSRLLGGETSFQFYAEISKETAATVATYRDYSFGSTTRNFAIGLTELEPYIVEWSPNGELSDPTILNPTFTAVDNATYTLNVTDDCGRTISDMVNIEVSPIEMSEETVSIDSGFVFNGVEITSDTILIDTLTSVNGCDSIATINVTVITATTELFPASVQLTLSPNPTPGELNVQVTDNGFIGNSAIHVFITDMNGRRLIKQPFSGNQTRINVSNLPAGTYLLELRTETGFTRKRFIKI